MTVQELNHTTKLDSILHDIVRQYGRRDLDRAFVVDNEHLVITIARTPHRDTVVNVLITHPDNQGGRLDGGRLEGGDMLRNIIEKCPIEERTHSYVYFVTNTASKARELLTTSLKTSQTNISTLSKGTTVKTRNNKRDGFKQVMT